MKNLFCLLASLLLLFCVAGCTPFAPKAGGTEIHLSDNGITVNGETVSQDSAQAVYTAHDIVYYEAGKDFTYGEGSEADAHTKEEADAHTVLHITKAGKYVISGTLSKGQIAVDLGEDAENDPHAVVTLVLAETNITCDVAPAIIFYNVYECGSKDEEDATRNVDTAKAGANVVIADGTKNVVNGAYVARIYKPDSVELNADGTAVEDAKKLHKYDAAFYSKMSMNIDSGKQGTGHLFIDAENEGLDSELHLTINGGNIHIVSGNDGINTNEDGISVTTINGGHLNIRVDGETGEGDGIDSNGWLVINGGTVFAQGCATSGDAGIDSDLGIHLNGGTVFATGNMLDRISESKQNYAVFQFADKASENAYAVKKGDQTLLEQDIINDFTYWVVSSPDLKAGDYTLWQGDIQLSGVKNENGGMGGRPNFGERPEGERPEIPEGEFGEHPEGERPEMPEGGFGEHPEGERPEIPEGGFGERPEGEQPSRPNGEFSGNNGNLSTVFTIQNGGNYFVNIG